MKPLQQIVFLCLFLLCYGQLISQVRLPQLVRDSMILQRDTKINIWGWAKPGEKVAVRFNAKSYRTTTPPDGRWMISMAAVKAGGPYTMQIDASNHIVLKDILVGDVWFCSGQSNMVHQMSLHKETYEKDIAAADNSLIRHFGIPTITDLDKPRQDLPSGYWRTANPKDVLQFSAVAYFFAQKIYQQYKIPIGLINASVGGTPIEAWTSEEGLRAFPAISNTIVRNRDTAYVGSVNRTFAQAIAAVPKPLDKGLLAKPGWFDTLYTATGWRTITVPGYWEDQGAGDLNGIVWYRREIIVPSTMTGKPAKVTLGRIVDADILYINGRQVGNTTYQYPQRRYSLPAEVLKQGKNLVVVRVTNNSGKGGFVPGKPYYISAGTDTIDLKGNWEYKVGDAFAKDPPTGNFSAQNAPAALYNAMVSPATKYNIRGILWYQGESNAADPTAYYQLMAALIADWRKQWAVPGLPFLFVQLPGYMDVKYLPVESNWALMREAQFKTLAIPQTGMAVAIDLGEWNDIHPDNKKDVGERLALTAMHIAYKDTNTVYSGPLYQSHIIDDDKIIISFTNTGSGLTTKDGNEPGEFAIAGEDKKFIWARTRIENNRIIAWHESIKKPVHIRYAWADNPDNPNFYNKEGLPASPFRTDFKK